MLILLIYQIKYKIFKIKMNYLRNMVLNFVFDKNLNPYKNDQKSTYRNVE